MQTESKNYGTDNTKQSNQKQFDDEDLEKADELFSTLENKINSLKSKLKSNDSDQQSSDQFELIDRTDLKQKLNDLILGLITGDQFALCKKYLLAKSNSKAIILVQETCVRLLTQSVQHSFEHAKQISSEFAYFNETKNWLEKFLLMKQTDLREMSVEFLLSFLKYTQSGSNYEYLSLIKKIFLKSQDAKSNLTLINCLFSHINSDSKETVEFMLQELLFRVVQNDSFTKSDKIRLFNEKILSNVIKLYEWSEANIEDAEILKVREMINEFLKILFCSTRYGINFYDKTMSVDSGAKNLNHVIFNSLISIQRNSTTNKNLASETNNLIDELFLKTFKVCPDLIQRFLKVKLKQAGQDQDLWLFKFMCRLFDQQSQSIKNMLKNCSGTTCYLRSLSGSETEDYLCELIVNTSIPLCFSFQKLLAQELDPVKLDLVLKLLISSLNCVSEWKTCLGQIELDPEVPDEQAKVSIYESTKRVLQNSPNFDSKLNLELLSKHFPKFDVFTSFNLVEKQRVEVLCRSFEIFGLYFEIFTDSVNFMEVESLEVSLSDKVAALISTDSSDVCAKYLEFLIKLNELKFRERVNFDEEASLDKMIRNLVDILYVHRSDEKIKTLIPFYLRLVQVFMSPSQDLVKYDKDFVYLYLIGVKQQFESNPVDLDDFKKFIKDFFSNLLSFKKRNSILFNLSLNLGAEIDKFKFNDLICLLSVQSYSSVSKTVVHSFLANYLFNSSLVYVDTELRQPLDLFDLVEKLNLLKDGSESIKSDIGIKMNDLKEIFRKKSQSRWLMVIKLR